jgi:YggT family protein
VRLDGVISCDTPPALVGAAAVPPEFVLMGLRLLALYQIVLLVRIAASWLAIDRHAGWYRLVVSLTEPLLGPLRRQLPPVGPVDVSPIAAFLVLLIAQELLKMLGR